MVAAPLSPDELLERADLAGHAKVLSVTDGRARLRFDRLLKGRPRGQTFWHRLGLARSVTVRLRRPAEPMTLGEWTDAGAFVPGTRVIAHLAWNDERGDYESLWWNAVTRERPRS